MRYDPIRTKPRPFDRVYAGVAPGHDCRWRGVSRRGLTVVVDSTRVREQQQQARDATRRGLS